MAKRTRTKDQYDFSKGERGKFCRPDLTLIPPVDLDPEVRDYLTERAEAKGMTLTSLVNLILKKGYRVDRKRQVGKTRT
ncbi:MAG: hypothetical protein QOJ54_2897 [Aliidongia sp.]|jgi:hypothetical protein|nr:hypothetical protein [Aliidongia sp.]